MKPLTVVLVFFVYIGLNLPEAVADDRAGSAVSSASTAASVDPVLRQLLQTNRELSKRLDEQHQQLQLLIQEKDDAVERFQKLLKALDEKHQQLQQQLEEEIQRQNQQNQDLEKEIQDLKRSHERQIHALQMQIDEYKEKRAADFDTVEFDCIEFIKIPAGTFLMGTDSDTQAALSSLGWWKPLYRCEQPAREVTLSKPFFISKYEITQEQWKRVIERDPSVFNGDNRPVENVSWYDAIRFTDALSKKWKAKYRLPTEAEWEYCARAGGNGIYGRGVDAEHITPDTIANYAWITSNSEKKTQPVGKKQPNAWGLHDMYGNVWEWCDDHFLCEAYQNVPTVDPRFRGDVTESVFRGGCWDLEDQHARAAFRSGNLKEHNASFIGFRIVRETR